MTIRNWVTANGSWELAGNWSPAGVPTTADTIIFDTGFTGPGYNNQSGDPTYLVSANTSEPDVLTGISVIGDAVRFSGLVASSTLGIENQGYLGVGDAALYAGTLIVGAATAQGGAGTGGELYIGGLSANATFIPGFFEDANGLINGTGSQEAEVVLSGGTWVNTNGLTIEGRSAVLFLDGGFLATGSSGAVVTSGATISDDGATIDGGFTLAGGTLTGIDSENFIVDDVVLDGTANVFNPINLILGSIDDGTIAGGFTAAPDEALSLTGSGDFSGGVTIASGTLDLAASHAAGSGAINFAPGATATLRIESDALPTNPIEGFAPGNTIALPFIAYDAGLSVADVGGTVTVADGQTIEALLTFAGPDVALPLSIGIDPSGATDLIASGATVAYASAISGLWNAPSLWTPAIVPGASNVVIISTPGSYFLEITGTQQAASLSDSGGANLVIDAGSTLSVANGLVMAGGTLTVLGELLASDIAMSNATLRVGGEIFSGALNYYLSPTRILSKGSEIDLVGSLSVALQLEETNTVPVVLDATGGTGTLSASLEQPGGIIARGNVEVSGTASTVLMQSGTLTDTSSAGIVVFAGGVNAELQMANGFGTRTSAVTAAVAPGGGSDTVVAHGGSGTIFGGSGQLTFIGFGSSQAVDPDAGIFPSLPYSALVIGGVGSLAAYGGLSPYGGVLYGTNIFFGGSAGNNVLVSGDGASSLVAGGSGDRLYADGTASVFLVAASGNETLSGVGSTAGNVFFGGSGNDLIVAGGGNDTVLAGGGTQTMFAGNTHGTAIMAGSGQDLVLAGASPDYIAVGSGAATVFAGAYDIFGAVDGQAGGVMDIVGFDTATDVFALQGYDANVASLVLASATVAGGNTVLVLPDATKVVLFGVTNLGASNL